MNKRSSLDMTDEKPVEKPAITIPMLQSDLISIILLGALTGIVMWVLGMFLYRFVLDAYLCQGDISSQCSEGTANYAALIAGIVGSVGALFGLIQLRVYRPLLVVIASMFSLWGIIQITWGIGWFTGILMVGLLYGLAFGVYSWIARLREFWIAFISIILIILAVRLALLV